MFAKPVANCCLDNIHNKPQATTSQHRPKYGKKLATKESHNDLQEDRKTEVSLEAWATQVAKWSRVRCPDCGLVIQKVETEKHDMECQGEILTC